MQYYVYYGNNNNIYYYYRVEMSLHCVKEQNFHDQQLQIRRFDFESVKDVWHKSFGLAIYKNEGGTTQQKKKKRFFFSSSDLSFNPPPTQLLTHFFNYCKKTELGSCCRLQLYHRSLCNKAIFMQQMSNLTLIPIRIRKFRFYFFSL